MKGKLIAPLPIAGMTGAVQATRWVGGTTSGAPTTGTFAVGDYVIARDGAVFICTTAGTPGTWADMSSGKELGYAEVTSSLTTTVTTDANRVDASGLIITVTVGTRPIILEFYGWVWNTTLNSGVSIFLVENAAGNSNNTPILQKANMISAGIASASIPFNLRARLAPSAGSHTYKVMFAAITSGTATIFGSSVAPLAQSFIRAQNV